MFRYYFSPLFWAAVILLLSIIPSRELPDISFWKIFSFDKMAHMFMYGIFSFQVMKSCVRQYANWSLRYNAGKVAAFTGIAYGGLIELLQQYVFTDRTGDWLDMLANVIGTFCGILLFRFIFIEYIR